MHQNRLLPLLVVVWILAPAKVLPVPAADCRDADLVLRNAKIVTMNAAGSIAEAMAVRDGKILGVGTNPEIIPCSSPRTNVVDLDSQIVLPGLIDVHSHALEWAKGILRKEIDANFPKVRSVADIVGKVRKRVAAAGSGEWIVGFGWDDAKLTEGRYVTRRDLDPVSPDNPVYLVHVSGHLAVANSAALARAGITRATPDPDGGLIERDAEGEPTGIVKDTAMGMVARLLSPDPPDLAMQAAKVVSETALEVGLTTIHDIWLSPEDMRGYQDAYQRGWLKVRVQMVPGVRNVSDAEQLVKMGLHTGFGDDYLELGAVKLFADGGMGARTVAIYAPPVAGEPDNFGLLIWKSEDLQKAHRILAAGGWQIVTHAIGDRAIDQVLDSYAATIKALDLHEPRFRIAHCGICTPAIQKRLRELNVLVDGNPAFVYWIGSWFRKYGPERVRWSYPGKSYFDNGIVTGAGSDVGVTPISPWWGIWAGVVRRELISGEVLAPEERLTMPQVLQLYTGNGAYIGFEEDKKGSLEAGKLADFIVVDRDVLTIPKDELKDVQVLKTYVGGELVYEKREGPLASPSQNQRQARRHRIQRTIQPGSKGDAMNNQATAIEAREWGYLLGGEFRTSGKPFEVRSPYDDSLVGITFRPTEKDLEEAVQQAVSAFPVAAVLPTFRRAEILRSMSSGLEARREELIRVLALEAGKPRKAGSVEVDRAIFNFRHASEEAQRIENDFIALDLLPAAQGRWGVIRRFPIGPVLAITPFNFPLNLVGHKIAPALAAGNSVVQKPATKTPLCSLVLAEIAQQAGVPAGVVNVVPCSGAQAERLVQDERFKLFTFTGSADIGWGLKAKAGKKRVTLELGGNAGVIIHSDANLEFAAERCALGGFSYAGQSCISVQRIFVHRPIWDRFSTAFIDRVRALQVGDPLDAATDVGPMITLDDAKRIEAWVKEAVEAGAKLLTGGKRDDALYQPTVLTETRPSMTVNCFEVFAPVVTMGAYDSFEQAVEAVNDSAFGLQAGVFTADVKAVFRAFEKLEVGGVVANDVPTFRIDHMPYGGMKDSGTGREGARYAIEEMTERKILVLNLGT